MNKQFTTYEIALKLKELDFNEECFAYWYGEGDLIYCNSSSNGIYPFKEQRDDNSATAPLWQQVIDWFREEHKIYIDIFRGEFGWHYAIKRKGKSTHWENCLEPFNEVREQAILKAIELIENGKKDN